MVKRIKTWRHLSLWANQVDALKKIRTYLHSPTKSALVQMPTGSGKTGVIAVISAIQSAEGPVLVLSPSRGIADQLERELRDKFWVKLAKSIPPPLHSDEIHSLRPKHADSILENLTRRQDKRAVLIGTIQGWTETTRVGSPLVNYLKNNGSLVLFDEGHREPAPSWSDAVRGLQLPTVLFSATPFRNDFRLFEVSHKHSLFLSFRECVDRHVIRDVRFDELTDSESHTSFARSVVSHVRLLIERKELNPNSKVIVRYRSRQSVESGFHAFQKALRGTTDGILAFHDNFSARHPQMRSQVPDLSNRSERYLLHQFKLIEGIDDPACSVVALFDDFQNERQLVQQVGRVVRHPHPWKHQVAPARVLVRAGGRADQMWKRFLAYDNEVRRTGSAPILAEKSIVDRVLDQFPTLIYLTGRFRERLDLSALSVAEEIRVPKSAFVLEISKDLSDNDINRATSRFLQEEERVVLKEETIVCAHPVNLILSTKIGLSRHFEDHFFPEISLKVTAICRVANFLFVYDSDGLTLNGPSFGRRVPPAHLCALLEDSEHTTVRMLNLANSDISAGAIRSRTLSANSLKNSLPFMADRSYIITRLSGKNPAGSIRYLGLSRGRITESSAEYIPLAGFGAWCRVIADELNSDQKPTELLTWFARQLPTPESAPPAHGLLDLDELEDFSFERDRTMVDNDAPILERLTFVEWDADIVNTPCDSDASYTHELTVQTESSISGREHHRIYLGYDKATGRYRVNAESLADYHDAVRPRQNIPVVLERLQPFRLITNDPLMMYARGRFYDIDINELTHDRRLMELLVPAKEVDFSTTEKGHGEGLQRTWSTDSLFHTVDRQLCRQSERQRAGLFGKRFPYVVCDDLQAEVADFVAFDTAEPRVCFVHVKARSPQNSSYVSASSLYDVCSQVKKNLRYIRAGNREFPVNTGRWDGNWKIENYEVPRMRSGDLNARQFTKALIDVLARPSTRREVWVVAGNTLSASRFDSMLREQRVPANAIQTAYLLMSTYTECKSFGVELKILCSP